MAVFNEPSQWNTSLVVNGDTNVIPQSTPAGSGALSFDDGFPQITQIPLGAGGIAPDRKDFNAVMKLLGDAVFYMQNGGLWSYNSAFDYAVGRVVLYTDGNLYKCIQANGASSTVIAPTNTTYWAKVVTLSDFANFANVDLSNLSASGQALFNNKANVDLSNLSASGLMNLVPTGVILPFGGSVIPNGFLLCNGVAISRTTFTKLYSIIGITFGGGDGSTTFNIPDLRDRYIIGANTNALGTYIAEQLPNITGEIQSNGGGLYTTPFANNAFSNSGETGYVNPQYPGNSRVTFNAHNSNSIYTDNGKVYPASIALNFIIKT